MKRAFAAAVVSAAVVWSLLAAPQPAKKAAAPKPPSAAQIQKEKVEALRKQIKAEKCESSFSCWCDYFNRKWITDKSSATPLPQAELDAISDRYIALLGEIVAVATNDVRARLDLGEAYFFRQFYDKARVEYETAEEILKK